VSLNISIIINTSSWWMWGLTNIDKRRYLLVEKSGSFSF